MGHVYDCIFPPVPERECHANHTYLTHRSVVGDLKERPMQRISIEEHM